VLEAEKARKKRRENMSLREIQKEIQVCSEVKVKLEEEIGSLNDKIQNITSNIGETYQDPELYMLDEMLHHSHIQQEFEWENFANNVTLEKFRKDKDQMSDLIMRACKNDKKNSNVWKPDKCSLSDNILQAVVKLG
jgi:hypothetical protein